MKLPLNLVCTQCGWFGNEPDEIGTHAPLDICPLCKSPKLAAPLFKNPFDQYKPFNNQSNIGFGSRVWTYGYGNFGIVIRIKAPLGYYKVAWSTEYGTHIHSYHHVSALGWVKP